MDRDVLTSSADGNSQAPTVPPVGIRQTPALETLAEQSGRSLAVYFGLLDEDGVDRLYIALASMGHVASLDLLLSTRGGHALSAFRCGRMLQGCSDHLRVIVPRRARSAGTLLSLAAEEIVLGRCAELGPLDATVSIDNSARASEGRWSTEDLRALRDLCGDEEWIALRPARAETEDWDSWHHGLSFAAITQIYRAERLVEQLAIDLLTQRAKMSAGAAEQTVQRLLHGYHSHDFPIFREEAAALGLNVTAPAAADELLLWRAYWECVGLIRSCGPISGGPRSSFAIARRAGGTWPRCDQPCNPRTAEQACLYDRELSVGRALWQCY